MNLITYWKVDSVPLAYIRLHSLLHSFIVKSLNLTVLYLKQLNAYETNGLSNHNNDLNETKCSKASQLSETAKWTRDALLLGVLSATSKNPQSVAGSVLQERLCLN